VNHLPFIVGAYAIAAGGTVALVVHAFLAMRRTEAEADALKGEK
jgi:hypothetical protein